MTFLTAPRTAPLSRRTLLAAAAGATAVGFTAAQADFLRARAQEDQSLQDILDIIVTTEAFGVAFLGAGLEANANGEFDAAWSDRLVAIVTAAHAQEQAHKEAFEAAGGTALYETFTVPPSYLTLFADFFTAIVEQETAETGAAAAAIRQFSDLGRPDLVKVMFQYGAEEAEHRVLANYAAGSRPANDRAFANAPYDTVAEFLDSLRSRGIIEGVGTEVSYPGPLEPDFTNVIETEPGGVAVDCGDVASTPIPATPESGTPESTGATTPEAQPSLAGATPATTPGATPAA
jgi:hypothetical protein